MVAKDQLIALINKGYTRKQVSEHLNMGYSTVYKYMSRYGLTFLNREGKVPHRCETCSETNPSMFYQGRKVKCKRCFNQECGEKQKQQKARAIAYKGGSCQHCGYDKTNAALEFHHIDPAQKDPEWRINWSWSRLQAELDKCILLCANCHREEHERLMAS